MRLLPLMLLVVCCSASAEWVLVGMSEEALHYVNTETISGRGRIRKVWIVVNLLSQNPEQFNGASSIRVFQEHECKERMSRIIDESYHSKEWADGKILFTRRGDGRWAAIPPETVVEAINKFVCSK